MYINPLFSGSSGNCTLIGTERGLFMVDAGKSASTVSAALSLAGEKPEDIAAIFITHEHTDHIAGVGVLCRRYGIPVYANAPTWQAMGPLIGEVPPKCVRVFESGRDFFVGGISVLPFRTPHDAAESVGYSFLSGDERKITVMTDIGHMDSRLLSCAAGSDILMIESNHDEELVSSCRYPYPTKRRILSDLGHLSNASCGRALCELYSAGVRRAILGHLSRDNNFESLALETVRSELLNQDIPESEFALAVAHRDRMTGRFDV